MAGISCMSLITSAHHWTTVHCIVKRTLVVNFWLIRSGNLSDQAMEDFTTGYENIVGQSAVLRWKYLTEIPAGIYYYMAHSFYACYFRKCCKYCLLIAKNCGDYWTYLARPFFGFNSRVRHGEVFSWVNLPAISQKVNNDITIRASLSTPPE